jgi:hypothetical protein
MFQLSRFAPALLGSSLTLLIPTATLAQTTDPVTLTFSDPQTAVLDPLHWDKPFPGELYYDALRPLLIRFPGMADAIATKMGEGYAVESIVLNLTWDKQEGARPERGRHGWGAEKAYTDMPGEWSAQAHALLHPWQTGDYATSPTADAFVNALGYWAHNAARGDGSDRLAHAFGPQPLHHQATNAAIDLTALLKDPDYAASPGAALRAFEQQGVQITKPEIFDARYNDQEGAWFDFYSWRAGIGSMKIWVEPPTLTVTLRHDPTLAAQAGAVPPPIDFAALVEELKTHPVGHSSMAPPENWSRLVRPFLNQPYTMPDWQWERIQNLHQLSGWNLGRFDAAPILSLDPAEYRKVGQYLKDFPRWWAGHLTTDFALAPSAFGDLIPPALQDHWKIYWQAWLHPEVEDAEDPRHRSYFRQYTWTLGTQNFNYNAVAGAYLASQFIDAPYPLRDAQYGLENLMLRTFLYYSGVNQEIGDTYYQALSIAGLQMLAKYIDDPYYRLMATIGAERQLEQLASIYNPNLRRITHPMGRGELKNQNAYQDGPYFALHTLSPSGTLIDVNEGIGAVKYGIPLFGWEGPPARIALLAPWAEDYWSHIVDGKSLPWQSTARYYAFLPDNDYPGEWHINYLANNYALASRSEDGNPVTHVTAQWRREAKQPETMEDISTLQLSFGSNARVEQAMASWGIVHHANKLVALKALPPRGFLTFPPNPDYSGGWRAEDESRGKDAFNALNASIMIIDFGNVDGREVWIGNEKNEQLSGASSPPITDHRHRFEQHLRTTGVNSVFTRTGETIMIKDGVTYLALIPLAFNALPRDQEVEVAYEWPVLYVHAFLYRGADAISQDDWYDAENPATAGFVIELGDESEYGSFENFRKHIEATRLTADWNTDEAFAEIAYQSGDDLLEMGFHPWTMARWDTNPESVRAPLYRRINGEWPPLPDDIQRDTPWSVQGFGGRLEKNGAVLESEPGFRTYLLAEPETGIITAYNPLPDPIFWKLTLPEEGLIEADGRVGLLRVEYNPEAHTLDVQHQHRPGWEGRADHARALILTEFDHPPAIMFNGRPTGLLTGAGQTYVLPLAEGVEAIESQVRLDTANDHWQQILADGPTLFFQDWMVVGPFPNGGYSAHYFQTRDFGPEQGYDPGAVYPGLKPGEPTGDVRRPAPPVPTDVRWQPLLAEGEPVYSDQPVDLLPVFDPGVGVIAYATTIIESDRDRRVQLLTGGDERLGIWINDEPVLINRGYRLAYRDQDRTFIDLKEGENTVMLKLGHGYEAWRLYFRLADEWGHPITDGITLKRPQ